MIFETWHNDQFNMYFWSKNKFKMPRIAPHKRIKFLYVRTIPRVSNHETPPWNSCNWHYNPTSKTFE
jgi:hypothetical protein